MERILVIYTNLHDVIFMKAEIFVYKPELVST